MGKRVSEYVLKFKENVQSRLKKIAGGQDHVAKKFDKINVKINRFKAGIRSTINEIPLLRNAVNLLQNPFAIVGGLAVGIALGLGSATTAAANFNHEFLSIQNLNLDKSNNQLQQLKGNILSLSLQEGFNAGETVKAFYDVQSATGLYGKAVEDITRKVGRFSIATGADMGASINSTVKAMKAFGMGVNEIDAYLASNAKTVQVGITTFDELAQVQTEYAGAAAAVNQKVDTANKVFAAFTAIAKDSNTAATMTKAAFEGLTQTNTVKGLKSIGVNMFDAKGQMRDVDAVVKDLVPRLKGMTDMQFSNLLNQIGGSEGLRNLLKQLKVAGDDVITTFDAFDRSSFSIEEALKNAKGDYTTLKNLVSNQVNTAMIMLGQQILPIVIRGFAAFNSMMSWFSSNAGLVKDILVSIGIALVGMGAAWVVSNAAMLAAGATMLWVKGSTAVLTAAQWLLNAALTANPIGIVVGALAALGAAFYLAWQRSEKFRAILMGAWEVIKGFGVLVKDYIIDRIKGVVTGVTGLGKTLRAFFKGDWKNAWETGKQAMLDLTGTQAKINLAKNAGGLADDWKKGYQKGLDSYKNDQAVDGATDKAAQGATAGGSKTIPGVGPGTSATSINSVAGGGGGTRQRNVTVHIGKLVESIVIQSQGAQLNMDELVAKVEEALVRSVRGSEQMLANG
ncbi:MAG: phage tail tape measure protein [Crocinitomicaceae bacterium]|nr:phage tail tape measure protein [Crocinitomicaceae bacterium]|tara:strand:+ start:4995 stop:7031 length:2037 start_codon:yes stop_codon:yes gene_type:complete